MNFSIPKESDDPFQILGIPRDADDKTVKSAYRSLAKRCHPDRNPDQLEAEMRFRQIRQAYDAIMTSRQRFPAGVDRSIVGQDEFRLGPDPFGGFYWMLRAYLAKKKT